MENRNRNKPTKFQGQRGPHALPKGWPCDATYNSLGCMCYMRRCPFLLDFWAAFKTTLSHSSELHFTSHINLRTLLSWLYKIMLTNQTYLLSFLAVTGIFQRLFVFRWTSSSPLFLHRFPSFFLQNLLLTLKNIILTKKPLNLVEILLKNVWNGLWST